MNLYIGRHNVFQNKLVKLINGKIRLYYECHLRNLIKFLSISELEFLPFLQAKLFFHLELGKLHSVFPQSLFIFFKR